MATEKTDVVIVGVGAAGGILAAELGKAGGRVLVEQPVFATGVHRLGRSRPPEPRPPRCLDHKSSGFGVEFHVLRQLCLVEQHLGDTDALRIPDANNACLHVITL